jgi:hypothetical protein
MVILVLIKLFGMVGVDGGGRGMQAGVPAGKDREDEKRGGSSALRLPAHHLIPYHHL